MMRHAGNMRASSGSLTLLLTPESSNLVNMLQALYKPRVAVKDKMTTRRNCNGRGSLLVPDRSAPGLLTERAASLGGIIYLRVFLCVVVGCRRKWDFLGVCDARMDEEFVLCVWTLDSGT